MGALVMGTFRHREDAAGEGVIRTHKRGSGLKRELFLSSCGTEAMSMGMAIQETDDLFTEGLCMWVQSYLCGCKLICLCFRALEAGLEIGVGLM